jgi:putative transcriptional regulator
MTIIRYTLDRHNPPKLSKETIARPDAMTDEEIERNARSDTDNPPLTDEDFEKIAVIREVTAARKATGLTQARFAERYRINVRRLQDIEIGRSRPDSAFMAYMRVIWKNPALVDEALRELV